MTFLGVVCKGDSAEIVTDTGSYTADDAKVRKTTKVYPYHHLDAVFTSSGSGAFSHYAHRKSLVASLQSDTFDELVETAPKWLQAALDESGIDTAAIASGALDMMSGTVVLVGYSEGLSEYAAYTFTPTDITGQRVEDVLVKPMPFTRRIPRDELRRIVKGFRKAGLPEDVLGDFYQDWISAPKVSVPESDDDWIQLVELAREERTLGGPLIRVLITGPIRHTRMMQGSIHTRTIHQFEDESDPELLARMFAASKHPIGQVSPCGWCDSGKPAIDCCFQENLPDPCECGSDKTFGDCCAVRDQDAVPRDQLWTTRFYEDE